MIDATQSEAIKKIIAGSQNIIIALPLSPSHDHVAASLALYLSLKDSKKNVNISCGSDMVVEFSHLVGVDKIKSKAGNQNLVVSFDYIQDSIEKVSYHVEGEKFNLVVQPKSGSKPLDPKTVSYSHQGLNMDAVFCIGCSSLEAIGDIYSKNTKAFEKAQIVSLHVRTHPPFAQVSITTSQASAICEVVYHLMSTAQIPLSIDAASNLLAGIDMATNRFSAPKTPASAFIIAGNLMQAGAKRRDRMTERPKIPNIPMPTQVKSKTKPLMRPMPILDSQNTTPLSAADQAQAIESAIPVPGQEQIEVAADDIKNAPKDWLKPKIFHGSTKV